MTSSRLLSAAVQAFPATPVWEQVSAATCHAAVSALHLPACCFPQGGLPAPCLLLPAFLYHTPRILHFLLCIPYQTGLNEWWRGGDDDLFQEGEAGRPFLPATTTTINLPFFTMPLQEVMHHALNCSSFHLSTSPPFYLPSGNFISECDRQIPILFYFQNTAGNLPTGISACLLEELGLELGAPAAGGEEPSTATACLPAWDCHLPAYYRRGHFLPCLTAAFWRFILLRGEWNNLHTPWRGWVVEQGSTMPPPP